jgi:hypothetical protein
VLDLHAAVALSGCVEGLQVCQRQYLQSYVIARSSSTPQVFQNALAFGCIYAPSCPHRTAFFFAPVSKPTAKHRVQGGRRRPLFGGGGGAKEKLPRAVGMCPWPSAKCRAIVKDPRAYKKCGGRGTLTSNPYSLIFTALRLVFTA